MDKEKEFMKNIQAKKGFLIGGILIIVLCLIGEVYAFYNAKKIEKSPVTMVESHSKDLGTYACIEVTSMTDYFATYSEDNKEKEKFYFLFDENYVYIANLDQKSFDKLKTIYDYSYRDEDPEMKEPKPVKVCGNTKTIPDDLKKLAIDNYNAIIPNSELTSSNFTSYFGIYYMNTADTPMGNMVYTTIMVGIFAFVGALLVLAHNKRTKLTKSTMNVYEQKLEMIKSEAISEDALYNKKAKMYLTKNYIISYANGFEIIDYKNVVWVYPHELRRNGFVSQKSIYVVTSDAKAHVIATLPAGKKDRLMFDEIYNTLLLKVPDALKGYTKENIASVKELYKKN